MKTFKFHVHVIQDDVTVCELQFERQVTEKMYARAAAKDYVRALNFPKDSWFNIPWMEQVADDEDDEDCSWISNPLYTGSKAADFCSRNPINESGFFNWEKPQMSIQEIIELKMEANEDHKRWNVIGLKEDHQHLKDLIKRLRDGCDE